MSTNTVELHRVLKTTPDRLFRALTTAGAYAKWIPPHGFYGTVHEMDARVGGRYSMSFTNLTNGHSHSFGGEYLELEPGKRVRYTAEFDDAQLSGKMQTTVVMHEVLRGVEVHIKQEGIPPQIPTEMCYLGWQESLEQLAKLVEPEIKD